MKEVQNGFNAQRKRVKKMNTINRMKKPQTQQTETIYEEVIRRNSDMVYRLAYSLVKTRADADDIFQEVFLRYMQNAPAFQGAEHEKAWFLRVTMNCCKNFWKSPWTRRRVALEREEMEQGGLSCELDDDSAALVDAVKQLSKKYRIVIHLFYYEELSIEEIAKLTNAKASTVRTRLTRARRQLRSLLKEELRAFAE